MIVAEKQLQALIVTWRSPTDHGYVPLGRLVSGLGPAQPGYEFAYLSGAKGAGANGQGPLLAFPDIGRVYRSDDLFPFFQNRVIQPSRPEYPDFVRSLALDPDHAPPMDILIRTGGGRVTDPFEIFECPAQGEQLQPYRTHFLARGLRHLSKTSLDRVESLRTGEHLYLMRDCRNDYDGRALALRTDDRITVGYLPGFLVEMLHPWPQCGRAICHVAKANPPAVPLQQRLLCRLETRWPADFQPFATEPFMPISAKATCLFAP